MKEISFNRFRNSDVNQLYDKLISSNVLDKEQAGTVIHALSDITESIEKIYNNFIPQILDKDNNFDQVKDTLDNLKQEFSHILYHIEDAKLLGLKYWDK